jgi:hypothetical protein
MLKRIIVITVAFCTLNIIGFAQDEFKPIVDFKGSRFSAGYLDSGTNGSYPEGSFQMPDVKLRFNWQMAPDITVSTRMNLNNAAFGSLDCFYIDYKNLLLNVSPSLKDSLFNPVFRLGKLKVDFGEEQLSNDPINGFLIFNSAGNVAGYDEGMQLSQTYAKEKLGIPLKWSLSLTNGNSGSGADNQQSKAFALKVGALPMPELYASVNYYSTSELGLQNADMIYAGLATPPTNATEWMRIIQELDLRYDFLPGKENLLNPGSPAWSDSKAFVRATYGQFTDDGKDRAAPVVKVTDREGKYASVDGCYNATEKLYFGARYSYIDLDKSTVYASLNSVNANKYTRISVGSGYRLTENTHFKLEYTTNAETVPTGVAKPKNNQISTLFTVRF